LLFIDLKVNNTRARAHIDKMIILCMQEKTKFILNYYKIIAARLFDNKISRVFILHAHIVKNLIRQI